MSNVQKSQALLAPDWVSDVFGSIDKEFADIFGSNLATRIAGDFPKMNAEVVDQKLLLKFALSGMTSDDIQVNIENRVLTVSGRMSQEHRSEGRFLIRELKQSAFTRSLKLPEGIEGDPDAVMKDGLLTLTWKLKGLDDTPKVKKIEIKSG